MNKSAATCVALLTVISICWAFSACSKSRPVQLGFVAGLSGRVADLGTAGRNGAMLAVEQRNAAGGIKGHPVELIVRDDQQNPETARQVVAELIAKNVSCIIGPMTSSMATATVPLVNASGTIMLSPTVTTTGLSGTDDNFLRAISVTSDYAGKNARYQFEKLGHRKVAVIYDLTNKAYTEDWINGFRNTFERLGGRITLVKSFVSSDQVLFLATVKELLAAKPDVVLIASNAVDAAMISQQIRSIDSAMPIVMSEWASTERFIELAGAAAEGVAVSQFIDRNDTSERYLKFLARYRERFGQEPGYAGLAGYDAAMIAMDAHAAQKPGETLKQAITRIGTFQGVQRQVTIDRFGDADRATFVTVIRDGKYMTVE